MIQTTTEVHCMVAIHFTAACKECEWYLRQDSKEDAIHFGKRHSMDFGHRVEFKEEYEGANVYDSYESEELLQDRGDEPEEYLEGDFNSRYRFTS
jgi:hypothetical protein